MSTTQPKLKIAVGSDFLNGFGRLPQKIQKKVRRFLDEFTANPEASTHNYEKINAAPDPNLRSVRIDQDYRGIVLKPEKGNVYVLLWVDKHDDAYQWASRRTCGIHPGTGTMQVFLTEEAASASMREEAVEQTPAKSEPPSAPPLFEETTDKELLSLGVPENMFKYVREIRDENEVERLEKILPREAFEALYLLACGYTADEVRSDLGFDSEADVDTSDFSAAVERPSSQRQFVVVTDAAEMEKILSAPLEQWRIFLHPSQRRLVEMPANGPVRVLGSAGTGKTVAAMHRAAWLARKLRVRGGKVLFTTFTRNLAADISQNLKKLCSREEWENIEVINLDAWVRRFLEKQDYGLKLSYLDHKTEQLWQNALNLKPENGDYSAEFLRAEWDNVIQAHGITSRRDYLTISRVGRHRRLNRRQRSEIWPIFEEYRALLAENGLAEPADAFRAARELIESNKPTLPYRAVVVDEAQDFGNEAFRLIRALVPKGENDLFIVGDPHQRIYGQQVVLSHCGIDIRGRGRKLRINYRTTEEVKNWATGLLKGLSFDDLDTGSDDAGGVRSVLHGEAPVLESCASITAAAEKALAHLKHLLADAHHSPEGICVVAPYHEELEIIQSHLKEASIPVHKIQPAAADDTTSPGVRLATIHRVKGLEFDHVILAGRLADLEESSETTDLSIKNKALLYAASTRPRKSLYVLKVDKRKHRRV